MENEAKTGESASESKEDRKEKGKRNGRNEPWNQLPRLEQKVVQPEDQLRNEDVTYPSKFGEPSLVWRKIEAKRTGKLELRRFGQVDDIEEENSPSIVSPSRSSLSHEDLRRSTVAR